MFANMFISMLVMSYFSKFPKLKILIWIKYENGMTEILQNYNKVICFQALLRYLSLGIKNF